VKRFILDILKMTYFAVTFITMGKIMCSSNVDGFFQFAKALLFSASWPLLFLVDMGLKFFNWG
jgi:hypothetical protein